MQKVGFPKPKMREEKRIALIPADINRKICDPSLLHFQRGYGIDCGFSDDDYRRTGAHVVSESDAYGLDILCCPKFWYDDAELVKKGQTVFGWLHLEKGDSDTRRLEDMDATAIAWELMYKDGRSVFYRNSMLTGEIGIIHAIPYAGKHPSECHTAVIGRGEVGKAAMRQLRKFGVKDIDIYHSKNSHLLRKVIGSYDMVINCACASQVVLEKRHTADMKRGALLVDIGSGAVDITENRQLYRPVQEFNRGRNIYYRINHIPTLWHQTASRYISEDAAPYINMLLKGQMDKTLADAVVIDKGRVLEDRLSNK